MTEKVKISDGLASFVDSTASDHLIKKTRWFPLSSETSNYKKYKLVEAHFDCLKFKSTKSGMLSSIIFMLFASLIFGYGLFLGDFTISKLFPLSELSFENEIIINVFPMLLGLLMFLIGFIMFYFATTPRNFDKKSGYYWKGRKMPVKNSSKKFGKNFAELNDIHALQIIPRYIRRIGGGTTTIGGGSYTSYELNLVLKTGKRIHIVCHGKLDEMLKDAVRLSDFLEKPVWDATK